MDRRIGARPLVRVYSRTQLTRMMRDAGFLDVSTVVGGFDPEDTLPTDLLARRTRLLDDQRTLDFLGRTGGWYVMGTGRLDG